MQSIHDLRPDAYNHVWDNSIEPALELESGEADFSHVNPVSGPIFVKGARAGGVLEVELLEFKAKDWGWTAIIPGFGLLADEFPDPWLRISEVDAPAGRVRFADGITLPHRPFPGTLGVAPAEAGEHSIVPPSRFGGNMDIKHLRVGVRLLLPVGVDGALFSLGDTHAAQGDGEVCGTAIETAMDVTLRLTARNDLSILAPQYVVPPGALAESKSSGYHVCTGVGPDLMEAARDAVRATIAYLEEQRGLGREEAYAVASVAADLRIHEVVDAPNWVVGAFIPEEIFEEGG
jgi:acetamidase/formamidase